MKNEMNNEMVNESVASGQGIADDVKNLENESQHCLDTSRSEIRAMKLQHSIPHAEEPNTPGRGFSLMSFCPKNISVMDALIFSVSAKTATDQG